MIKSMTGYGKAQKDTPDLFLSIEIKTINSKFADISLRIPKMLNEKELEIRNIVQQQLERGKISVSIEFQQKTALTNTTLDGIQVAEYYKQLIQIASQLQAPTHDCFRMAVQLFETSTSGKTVGTLEKEEWILIEELLKEALKDCDNFRMQEGNSLAKQLSECIQKIDNLLVITAQEDPKRIEFVKQKIATRLTDIRNDENYDHNRFEQEMIYYLEKLDISEEKIRLKNHLDYFVEMLQNKDSNGKKLGFLAQEIGREINTIGSKANNVVIQRLVIDMKDELEKIKEQSMNLI
jgi:uncharacterized protein (TIGR00255 family)